jgi:membrane-associated phospholipid phosphatase
MTSRRIYPFDIIILIYLAVISILILIFGRPISGYYDELLAGFVFAAITGGMIYFLGRSDRKVILFVRLLYPALLFTFLYRQTGGLMHLFHSGFLDYQLTAFEKAILGVHPTFWIEHHILNTWLTELVSFTYLAYYPMIPAFLIFLFLKGDYDNIIRGLAAICLTFFAGYLLFYLYPIEGPRYFFAGQYSHAVNGPVFRQLVEFIQKHGSVHGGCMPSTHVGVAVVMNIFCLKYYRKAGIFLLIINTGMAFGTFYGRYHYVSDVVVGTVIGLIMTCLVLKYHRRWEAVTGIIQDTAKENKISVS